MLSLYRRSLHWVLENPVLILTVLFLTIALNVAIVIKIPKGFFPLQDTGSLGGAVRGPQDASFYAMNDSIQKILKVVKNDPAVAECDLVYWGRRRVQHREYVCVAEAFGERNISASDVINRLRPKLNRLTAASSFLQAAQDLRIGGRGSNALYQYTIQADNLADLPDVGAKAAGRDDATAGFSGRQFGPAEWRAG